MQTNGKRLRRILSLHKNLERVETSRLAKSEAHIVSLKEQETKLFHYLDAHDSILANFSSLILRRLQDNGQQTRNAVSARDEQANITRNQSRRVKQVERLVDRAEDERKRLLSIKELQDVIDRGFDPSKVSVP